MPDAPCITPFFHQQRFCFRFPSSGLYTHPTWHHLLDERGSLVCHTVLSRFRRIAAKREHHNSKYDVLQRIHKPHIDGIMLDHILRHEQDHHLIFAQKRFLPLLYAYEYKEQTNFSALSVLYVNMLKIQMLGTNNHRLQAAHPSPFSGGHIISPQLLVISCKKQL